MNAEIVPGEKKRYILISDGWRDRIGAVQGVNYALSDLLEQYPEGRGTKIHILITVEEKEVPNG